jgi:UDP-GlcNAc:undecaprenyl-phosphate/decaprenyl-phosphate GlcNAc-1-phosphate transferase
VGRSMPFVVGFALASLLTPIAAWIGPVLGIVDRVDGDALKIHSRPVSVLGGVAVVAATFGSLALVEAPSPWWLLAAAGLCLGGGLVDDVRHLPPWARVLVQLVAAAMLVAGGLRLEPLDALGAAGVIVLVLACVNAVNLVDGQDGLAGGLALLASLGLALLAATSGQSTATGLGLAAGGSLGGFLLWNRPPARVFLGNGGAYAVGILLAVLATMVVSEYGVRGMLAAGLCLGVFAFELVFTTARRVLDRSPLAAGDRSHSYDVLARATGRTRSTLIFWAGGATVAALSVVVSRVPIPVGVGVVAVAGGLAAFWGRYLRSRSVRGLRRTT